MDFDNEDKLDNIEEVMKDSTLNNPEITFCDKTTYLDFLLSNAKDDEEKKQIEKTINSFLNIYNDEESIDLEDDLDEEDE